MWKDEIIHSITLQYMNFYGVEDDLDKEVDPMKRAMIVEANELERLNRKIMANSFYYAKPSNIFYTNKENLI